MTANEHLGVQFSEYHEGNAHVFDAHVEGVNVGYARVEHRPDHAFLDSLYVSPEHRGKGIGGALLDRASRAYADREVRLRARPFGDSEGLSQPQLATVYAR